MSCAARARIFLYRNVLKGRDLHFRCRYKAVLQVIENCGCTSTRPQIPQPSIAPTTLLCFSGVQFLAAAEPRLT